MHTASCETTTGRTLGFEHTACSCQMELLLFTCHATTVTIHTSKTCHQDIPIDGPQPFAAVHTRIMKAASPIVPCTHEFLMRILGL